MASASAILNGRRAGSLPGPHSLAGPDHQQVAAQAGDLFRDLDGGAAAEGDHGDDRADADDDAEDGQERAQDVAADLAQGQHERVPEHQRAPPVSLVRLHQAVDEADDPPGIGGHVRHRA